MFLAFTKCISLAFLINSPPLLALPVSEVQDINLNNETAVEIFDQAKCEEIYPPYYRAVNPYEFCEPLIDRILSGRPNEIIDLGLLSNGGKWTSRGNECYFLWGPRGSRSDHARIRRSQLKSAALSLRKKCFPQWSARVPIAWGFIDLPSWNGQSALKYALSYDASFDTNSTSYFNAD